MTRLLFLLCLLATMRLAPAQLSLNPAGDLTFSQTEPQTNCQAYLYVEPYEARFEFLLRLPDALNWLADPKFQGSMLPPTAADEIREKAAALASTWLVAAADSKNANPELVVSQILKGRPGATLPLAPGEPLAVKDLWLAFMWKFPVPAEPRTVALRWSGFIEDVQNVPVKLLPEKRDDPTAYLTPDRPICSWLNEGRLAPPPPLAPVPALELPPKLRVPFGAIIWFTACFVFFVFIKTRRYRFPGGGMPYFAVWLLGTVLMMRLLVLPVTDPFAKPAKPISEPEEAQKVVSPLLRNIYRAFDQRDEEAVYDVLARGVDGPLLKKTYLDVLDALSLDEKEGARVRVNEFAAEVEKLTPDSEGGFTALTSWSVLGSVDHWGHKHTRTNVIEAEVTVQPRGDVWKITGIEVLNNTRL
ncbi:MAG: hypothetical protein KDK99_11690 [Verrucomicrobiales bacterium]|nr:hypothetical protein [Verrucomicrobiales bacterium]